MNYEFKGTKGEWKLINWRNEESGDTYDGWLITNNNRIQIGRVDSRFLEMHENATQETIDANAHLIACAPDLLKRCIDMVDALCGDQECEEELKKGLGIPVFNQMLLMKETIHEALNLLT